MSSRNTPSRTTFLSLVTLVIFLVVVSAASDAIGNKESARPHYHEQEEDEYDYDDMMMEEDGELPWPEGFEPFLGYEEGHEYTPFTFETWNLESYLNEGYRTPKKKAQISKLLQDGKLVILRDAFVEDFAQRVHEEIWDSPYEEVHGDFEDGFGFNHHNAYDPELLSEFLQDVVFLFRTEETLKWIHQLSGRDTLGYPANGAPSWYMPGDFSGPHSDNHHQRTVAYVWHLTKNWLPHWGGGLYWCHNSSWENAFTAASWNTLFLFSVSKETVHFVSHVTPRAEGRRLAFNGWWESEWYPEITDEKLPEYLFSKERRSNLTEYQVETLLDMMEDWAEDDPNAERYERLQPYLQLLSDEDKDKEMEYGEELWPGDPPGEEEETLETRTDEEL